MSETNTQDKVVGILGGMGPEATIDLMQRIVRLTPAKDDIDHVRCIVDNNPKVPSRIKAIIEGTGVNPGPCMADMGSRLETFGADFLAIACNTAHAYYQYVEDAVKIPVLHLVKLVADYIRNQYPESRKVGLLASPAIKITGLYAKEFNPYDIEVIFPDPEPQEELFALIRRVKAGDTGAETVEALERICKGLESSGADNIIIACTELSVLQQQLSIETIDAAEVLAQEIVAIAKNEKSIG